MESLKLTYFESILGKGGPHKPGAGLPRRSGSGAFGAETAETGVSR